MLFNQNYIIKLIFIILLNSIKELFTFTHIYTYNVYLRADSRATATRAGDFCEFSFQLIASYVRRNFFGI